MELRAVTDLEAALALAPALDARAAEFLGQFSDDPYPRGAARASLERHFDDPATVLLEAVPAGGRPHVALCLTGPFEEPLTAARTPMVLVLFVAAPARHQGLARALVEEAARILRSRGEARLAARAGHNDDALISMGERWGFVRLWELMLLE